MLSKNNWQEQLRKQEPKKQRFAIKKLTVGVASVLIGFTFMGLSASANADEVQNSSQPVETSAPANGSASSASDSVTKQAATVPADQTTTTLNTTNQTPVTASAAAESKQSTGQTENVTDATSFVNALNDGNTGTINVLNDIDFSNATSLNINQ